MSNNSLTVNLRQTKRPALRSPKKKTMVEAFEHMAESVLEVKDALLRETISSNDRLQEEVNRHSGLSEKRIQESVQKSLRESERRTEARIAEASRALVERMEEKMEEKLGSILREHASMEERIQESVREALLQSEQWVTARAAEECRAMVARMEEKMEEGLAAVREQIISLTERIQVIEERTAAATSRASTEENGTEQKFDDLERRMRMLDDSIKTATERSFPRLEAILKILETKPVRSESSNDIPSSSLSRVSRSDNDITSLERSAQLSDSSPQIPSHSTPVSERTLRDFFPSLHQPSSPGWIEVSCANCAIDSPCECQYTSPLPTSEFNAASNAVAMHLKSTAESGNVEAIRVYLDQRVNVDFQSSDGRSALHDAVFKDRPDVVARLLAGSADVDATMVDGRSVLHVAACTDICGGCVELLLAFGANIHQKNLSGETPLHDAARSGTEETVRQLIAADADVNDADLDAETPLHKAARGGNLPAVRLLVAAGARKDGKNRYRQTPHDLSRGDAMREALRP